MLDDLLWGSSSEEAEYVAFKERYVPYILPELRAVYRRHVGRPSLVDRAPFHGSSPRSKNGPPLAPGLDV